MFYIFSDINKFERKIPLHKKDSNLNYDENKANEEYELLCYIEYNKANQPIFEYSYPYLDRYSDIKPYKHNKVEISTASKYINASPINIGTKEKLFISTQGPKQETIEDFWTMVYDYKSQVIVMLCKEFEGGRKKCENYWDVKMKNFEIKRQEKDQEYNDYTIRTFILKKISNKEERKVVQIHYKGWPDHGIPDVSNKKVFEVFCEINKKVDELNDKKNPIIVHCSAGVGRTGTFVSMYLLEKEIDKQIKDKKNEIRINIFNLVRKIKEMRLYMVQTDSQYQFVYLFVKYLLETRNI